jgi:hypothetical protein
MNQRYEPTVKDNQVEKRRDPPDGEMEGIGL